MNTLIENIDQLPGAFVAHSDTIASGKGIFSLHAEPQGEAVRFSNFITYYFAKCKFSEIQGSKNV